MPSTYQISIIIDELFFIVVYYLMKFVASIIFNLELKLKK